MHISTLLLVFQLKKAWKGFLKVPWKHRRKSELWHNTKQALSFHQAVIPSAKNLCISHHITILYGTVTSAIKDHSTSCPLTPSALLDPNFYELPSSMGREGILLWWQVNIKFDNISWKITQHSWMYFLCCFFKGTSPLAGSGNSDQWAQKTHLPIGFRTL